MALLSRPQLVPWAVGTPHLLLMDPLPKKATFDGDPEKFFLNQIWAHLDCYALAYPMEVVMVNAVATQGRSHGVDDKAPR